MNKIGKAEHRATITGSGKRALPSQKAPSPPAPLARIEAHIGSVAKLNLTINAPANADRTNATIVKKMTEVERPG